jgi:hypothetical protein
MKVGRLIVHKTSDCLKLFSVLEQRINGNSAMAGIELQGSEAGLPEISLLDRKSEQL